MRRFKWIDWNLRKIDAHGLSAEDVEGAFDHVFSVRERKDRSFEMFAATVSGRRIGSFGAMIGRTLRCLTSSTTRTNCLYL